MSVANWRSPLVLLVVELTGTTTAASHANGGVAVLSCDLRVTLPDGTSVGTDPGPVTDFGGVLHPSESTTGTAGFEVPADLQGDIEVVLRAKHGPRGTSATWWSPPPP